MKKNKKLNDKGLKALISVAVILILAATAFGVVFGV